MRIKVKLSPGAKPPTPATEGSVGYDLYAYLKTPVVLHPSSWQLIPTGVHLELPKPEMAADCHWYAVEAQVRPRSGMALKHGITVLNSPGTIDLDYRGDVGVVLVHHGHAPLLISGGDKVGQLLFNYVCLPSIELVEELDSTSRGSGGFGSTDA